MSYSQNQKASGLDALTALDSTDVFVVGDMSDTGTAKKITKANLEADLATDGFYKAGGTDVAVADGGTGISTYTKGDLIVANSSTLAKLAVGTNGYVLLADSTQTNGVKWGANPLSFSTFAYTNIFGSSTTQFDITNPSGTTFRYTYDATGTDPVINSTTVPIGTTLVIAAQNFNAANNGTFVTTGVGSNYFEVTNASGVAENNKTLGTGTIKYGYTKSSSVQYILLEILGGGGGGEQGAAAPGGGSGCYAKGYLAAASISGTQTLTIGAGGTSAGNGGSSSFGSLVVAGGGLGSSGNTGGTLSGSATTGFFSFSANGGSGYTLTGATPDIGFGGQGGNTPYGTGGPVTPTEVGTARNGQDAKGYGAGGGGGTIATTAGGAGGQGMIIITEFY